MGHGSYLSIPFNKKGEKNMRKTRALLFAVIFIGLLYGVGSARAQDQAKDEPKKEAPKQSANTQPVEPYRLDFSLNELAEGKIVNTRHYSMNLTGMEPNEIKIGTRVPVVTASTSSANSPSQWQYIDVGTNIWAQLRDHGDEWILAVRSEVSNIDTTSSSEHVGGPAIRQIKLSGSTLLVLGRPLLISAMDDPNSKRQFQLEVTVTKLR